MEIKQKILLVDDEPDVLELLKEVFTKKGYDVKAVSSGQEALDLVESSAVDAVLLDIRMPVMDGIETLAKLKEKKPKLPVVMLTAYGYDDNFVNKALSLKASGYISKNLPIAQIIYNVQALLSSGPNK